MSVLGTLLMAAGAIVGLIGWIGVLLLAFRESTVWGILSLLIGIVWLIYAIMHWDEAKKPFLLSLGGSILMILGSVLAGAGTA